MCASLFVDALLFFVPHGVSATHFHALSSFLSFDIIMMKKVLSV